MRLGVPVHAVKVESDALLGGDDLLDGAGGAGGGTLSAGEEGKKAGRSRVGLLECPELMLDLLQGVTLVSLRRARVGAGGRPRGLGAGRAGGAGDVACEGRRVDGALGLVGEGGEEARDGHREVDDGRASARTQSRTLRITPGSWSHTISHTPTSSSSLARRCRRHSATSHHNTR